MRRAIKGTVAALFLGLLVFANVQLAWAHQWWTWHWHKNPLHLLVGGSHVHESLAAIRDWGKCQGDLKLHTQFRDHTNISVYGGNYGPTPWWGLAEIKEYSYDAWHLWNWSRIEHAHARYNSYYGGTTGTGSNSDVRGVFCQEIGHTFGLDHSDDGSCMGKGYFASGTNTTSAHVCQDLKNMY